MPNGVSCAYFAVRNHIYGQKEHNMFKEGIAACQTVRSGNALANSVPKSLPINQSTVSFLGKAAKFARKIVYPLIIASGIYNTVKSDDKIKTGAMQAGGIGTMYCFEQVAERGLKQLSKTLLNTNFVKSYKGASAGVAVIQGAGFATASILGYTIGSKVAEKIVDTARGGKNKEKQQKDIFADMELK